MSEKESSKTIHAHPVLIRLATRNSPLAIWQAEYVKQLLCDAYADLRVDIIGMTSKGDRLLDRTLAAVGGKGLFMKELEEAMLAGEADIAVHSMKDVTVKLPQGLEIAAVCEREQPQDAFVANHYSCIDELPDGAVVGTASLRRKTQLMNRYPNLVYKNLRGNVNTRLGKLDAGEYDAIILAAAGLIRLGFEQRISQYLPIETCLPAIGQGVVGIECRSNDMATKKLLQGISNVNSAYCIAAERSLNEALDGGCQVPIAGHAVLNGGQLELQGSVGDIETGQLLYAVATAPVSEADRLGKEVAESLLEQGAGELLAKL